MGCCGSKMDTEKAEAAAAEARTAPVILTKGASRQAGRAAQAAGRAARAPAAGRDAARHARAALRAAERQAGAGQRSLEKVNAERVKKGKPTYPKNDDLQRLLLPVLDHPVGQGGQGGPAERGRARRVRAAAEAGVAARGRGHRVRELVPRHADRDAARRARQLPQGEGAAGGGHLLLGVRLRDPADRRGPRPGAASASASAPSATRCC